MAVDIRKRGARMGPRLMTGNDELTRVVSALTRDVERIDSILSTQRRLLEERILNEQAERLWKQIWPSLSLPPHSA
jgi:hypothetical protein